MNSLLLNVIDKLNIGTILIDNDFKIVLWNTEMERLSRIFRENVLCKKVTEICTIFQNPMYYNYLNRAISQGESRFCSSALHKVFVLPKGDDNHSKHIRQNMRIEPIYLYEKSYVLIQIIDITDHFSNEVRMKNIVKDLEIAYSDIKESEATTRIIANQDFLTGLPNRLAFYNVMADMISKTAILNQKLALLFIDLDDLKQINDTYGHYYGDLLLINASHLLKEKLRGEDIAARMGGDEFIAVIQNVKSKSTLENIVQKLLNEISNITIIKDQKVKVSASIGVSVYPEDGTHIDDLIKKADQAMYIAKKSGKNAYSFFDSK